MNRFPVWIAILASLLIFQTWNLFAAKKRGSIFVSLWSYSKARNARDFNVAFWGNVIWFLALVGATILCVVDFLQDKK